MTPGAGSPASGARLPTVYFDGGCPLCTREIAAYRRREGAETLEWLDVSRCEASRLEGLAREDAIARLHVRAADGTLHEGVAAFALIWKRMPGFAWLGRIAERPGARPLLEAAYAVFLRVRPLWRPRPADAAPRA